MAKRYLTNIDLVQNQILNPVLQILGSDPGSPIEGQFWYNSTDDRFRYRANGVTLTPLTSASDIPNGAITIAQLAVDPLARANHTGTQLLATISDVTASAAEVNVLDGLLASTAELNFVDGVTSSIQTQLNTKAAIYSGASYTTATAAGTAAKTVTGAEPPSGSLVVITYTAGNTAASATVSFNGGSARAVQLGGSAATADEHTVAANTEVLYYFDGTILNLVGAQTNNETLGGDLTGTIASAAIAAGVIVNADINASAAIALSKLATDPLARANHTGTQLASTISDFDTQVRLSRLDQMAAPTAAVSMNSQLITNVATPVSGTDAANKTYVDTAVAGLSWKESVEAATTANITLSGTQTVDTVALIVGDRVLVKNQSTGSQNGIYIVAAGSWTRATDADSEADLLGAAVMVQEGGQAGTQWILTTDAPITVGTTALTFTQFGAGTSYSAGAGITLTGTVFSVDVGAGLTFSGNDLIPDTTIVARHFAASVGNGSLTSIAVTHNLGTRDVVVDVYDNATFDTVECDVVRTDTNNVTVTFAAAPASNAYRVVVVG